MNILLFMGLGVGEILAILIFLLLPFALIAFGVYLFRRKK